MSLGGKLRKGGKKLLKRSKAPSTAKTALKLYGMTKGAIPKRKMKEVASPAGDRAKKLKKRTSVKTELKVL